MVDVHNDSSMAFYYHIKKKKSECVFSYTVLVLAGEGLAIRKVITGLD